MEEAGLVKKGPESRVIREGFLEEEVLNPGLERRQTWISRREESGQSKFQEVPPRLL